MKEGFGDPLFKKLSSCLHGELFGVHGLRDQPRFCPAYWPFHTPR
jgi:hypothetical protein